jgi:hypothetical protein
MEQNIRNSDKKIEKLPAIEQAAKDIIQVRNVVVNKPIPSITWDGMSTMISDYHPRHFRKEILEVVDIIKRNTVKMLPYC